MTRGYFGPGEGPVFMTYVNCRGTESTILECSYNAISAALSCGLESDAGVQCLGNVDILTRFLIYIYHPYQRTYIIHITSEATQSKFWKLFSQTFRCYSDYNQMKIRENSGGFQMKFRWTSGGYEMVFRVFQGDFQ